MNGYTYMKQIPLSLNITVYSIVHCARNQSNSVYSYGTLRSKIRTNSKQRYESKGELFSISRQINFPIVLLLIAPDNASRSIFVRSRLMVTIDLFRARVQAYRLLLSSDIGVSLIV